MMELAGAMMWTWAVLFCLCVYGSIWAKQDEIRGALVAGIFANFGLTYVMWSIVNDCNIHWVMVVAIIYLIFEGIGSTMNMAGMDNATKRFVSFVKLVICILSFAVIVWVTNT